MNLQRRASNQFRLVKPTLALLDLVQWHWDDEDRRLLKRQLLKSWLQADQGLRQHASQYLGCRAQAVILQQVDQFAQATLITAVRYRSVKRTLQAPAYRTSPQPLGISLRISGKYTVPTNRTNLAPDRKDAA